MNKIYNNLNIKNLVKTEWFDRFDPNEQEEILEGLRNNLDVSWYAEKEFGGDFIENKSSQKQFNGNSLEKIRKGLK